MNINDFYPSEEQLEIIRKWKFELNDLHSLMEYVKPLWRYSDCGYWELKDDVYHISTAGWSGNEEIISAMQDNIIWWMMFWESSRRGGHYVFSKIKKI